MVCLLVNQNHVIVHVLVYLFKVNELFYWLCWTRDASMQMQRIIDVVST